MRCTVNIAINVLQNETPIAYKYVIDSPNRDGANKFEVLQGIDPHLNRCLVVPRAMCYPHGKYHLYMT